MSRDLQRLPDYLGVDVVWQTIQRDLPGLHAKIQAAHSRFADDQPGPT